MKRAIAVLALAVACGKGDVPKPAEPAAKAPPPPAAAEAKQLIASSPEWSEFDFTNAAYTLPMKRSQMNGPARAAATDLANGGWIRLAGDEVVLTGKAKSDKRFLVRPNGYVDIVPLGKKDLVDVASVTANPDGTAAADLAWRWIANDVGASFRSGQVFDRMNATHRARATLLHDGSAWTVLKIERLEN